VLENKLISLEESNEEISSVLRLKKAETDFEMYKMKALGGLKELNSILQFKWMSGVWHDWHMLF